MQKLTPEIREKILRHLQTIPRGKVTTYQNIWKIFGVHHRAVASVMRYNTEPVKFPCYKVIASSGKISGYNTDRGVIEKVEKLTADGIVIENGKISQDFII